MQPTRSLQRLITAPSTLARVHGWQELAWSQLLLQRGWLRRSAYDTAPLETQEAAIQHLSRKPSFPLTLAHAWEALGLHTEEASDGLHVCVLGAREEADEIGGVSIAAWLELCVHTQATDVRLSMIGPEASGEARALHAGEYSIRQSAPCSTAFVESSIGSRVARAEQHGAGDPVRAPDAYVLFNPGLHAGKYTWRPSIEAVLASGRPLLLTAYHEQDAASDAEWLRSELGVPSLPYEPNPWASLEPWIDAQDARANMLFTVHNGRGPPDAAGHGGQRRAARARVVPSEQGWARRSAMRDLFSEGSTVAREMVDIVSEALRTSSGKK